MNGDSRSDIRSLSLSEIGELFQALGEKSFRAKQVFEWLWVKSCRSFDEMTNLPKGTRDILKSRFTFHVASVEKTITSLDQTTKHMFLLEDGHRVEGVLIPSSTRTTACISSQVGCALNCTFCATGQLGFTRNLTAGEIFDQVILLNRQSEKMFNRPLDNIVYMGMGEPLLNYKEVMKSVSMLTSDNGRGISPQRITVSSVGIPKMIMKLADDGAKFHFALSLHVANEAKRSRIIPANKRYSISDIREALIYYHQKTGKRFTIEYILFHNFNDTVDDARELAEFCRSFPVKINLIEYNSTHTELFAKSQPAKRSAFKEYLERKNLVVNLRKSRGEDIAAACGQLALKESKP